jgi:hypothetical protein
LQRKEQHQHMAKYAYQFWSKKAKCVLKQNAPIRSKFQRWPPSSKPKIKMSKFKVPKRFCQKEHSYEIWKPSHTTKVKFSKSMSNFKVKVMRSKERSCHKEHIYEIWKPYHLLLKKIRSMLKCLQSRSNFKVMRSKIMVLIERSCHKEYTYEIWKPYHLPFKRYRQC